MTRINCVPPAELSGPHLVAEYRELPRTFALALEAQRRGERPDDPRNPRRYVLGTGHVRFFYDKGAFLLARQRSLVDEMLRRGYRPTHADPSSLVEGLGPDRMLDWTPDEAALELNRARIAARNRGE